MIVKIEILMKWEKNSEWMDCQNVSRVDGTKNCSCYCFHICVPVTTNWVRVALPAPHHSALYRTVFIDSGQTTTRVAMKVVAMDFAVAASHWWNFTTTWNSITYYTKKYTKDNKILQRTHTHTCQKWHHQYLTRWFYHCIRYRLSWFIKFLIISIQ